jgi:hypothetical protein
MASDASSRTLPTLLEVCVATIARHLPLPVPPSQTHVPEALVMRLTDAYTRLHQARRHAGNGTLHDASRHLAAMEQLAAFWSPTVLHLRAPACDGVYGVCGPLQLFVQCLAHLELASPASWLSGLDGLQQLTCLSLCKCPHLTSAALQAVLQGLPQVCGVLNRSFGVRHRHYLPAAQMCVVCLLLPAAAVPASWCRWTWRLWLLQMTPWRQRWWP